MSHTSIDQPGTVGTPSSQPTPSLPSTTYNTSNISGGTINNVHGDFHSNPVNHYYGLSSVDASVNPASQPPLPLPPFNDAPIDRISSCFTGRESELDFITTSFNTFQSDKPTRFVIYGMPGLGKSQLALQHANLAFTAGVYSHVFFVSASTVEKLGQGLARILGLLNHAERNHPDQAVQIAVVRLWLEQSDRHGCWRWLLILDNVTAESAQFLREHLPRQNASGNILITTRTRNIAESVANSAGQEHIIFELKALSKAQSVALLLKRAGVQTGAAEDLTSAEKLVSRIGCLPLAVEQAGSYMKRSGFKNASQMQRMYDSRGLKEVITWENNLTTYEEKSVLATITVQLQKLDEIDPDAHKLIKTLAFLDPDNIPINILSLGARAISDRLANNAGLWFNVFSAPEGKLSPILGSVKSLQEKKRRDTPDPLEGVPPDLRGLIELICSEERVRIALRHFEDLSIAQPLYDGEPSLHIHDLIQWVLQQGTILRQEEGYRALSITLLCHAFWTIDSPDEPQSWAECERFVPHFAALGTQDEMHPGMSEEYMDTKHCIAQYFTSRGRYAEAETLLGRVLVDRRRLLSSDNIRTFDVLHNLATVYARLGRYQEAEPQFLRVLAAAEKQLGVDHPSTLETVNALANLYQDQGKFDEAESLHARVLAGSEKQFGGADNPSTLRTVNNLASLHVSQGRYAEAESLYARALAGSEKQLGAEHPSRLITVNNLAGLYQSQGKFHEAESLYARALAGWEDQLGVDHPSTLTAVNNLASVHVSQGKFHKAEGLYARVLAGSEKQFGADHPSTLKTVNNLAGLYKRQGKFHEAEGLYVLAQSGWEKQLGADHPETLKTASNLAHLYQDQGKFHEAESLCARALAGCEKRLGADHPSTLSTVCNLAALAGSEKQLGTDHPSTLRTVNNLASLHVSQGRYVEAESLYARALAGSEKQLGVDHPSTLTTANNLAGLYVSQGRYAEAESLYARALAGLEKQLGADHPSTLAIVINIAGLYESQGKFHTAESLYARALAGWEKQLGADHPSTLTTVNNLAGLFVSQGRYAEAESLYARALAGLEKQLGADHPSTLAAVNNLAGLYESQRRYAEAESLYARALAGWEKQLGTDHPSTLATVHNIAYFQHQQGRHQEAEAFYRRALVGQGEKLGPDHPDTQLTLGHLAALLEVQGRHLEGNINSV
ncbi:TPR-like protein [Athelia psychrophila]|uniref:TPR-like protein n=1 Tax=Athelia psychrophila TaxID=1759441 RepID=A0A166KNR4_9AGAM|nr:TPR-like protein [Fibularhizoctonia sp. CBS 109695]